MNLLRKLVTAEAVQIAFVAGAIVGVVGEGLLFVAISAGFDAVHFLTSVT